MRIFENTNYDFLGKRKYFYATSLIIIIIGFVTLFIKGIPVGIDFVGGTELQIRFERDIDVSTLRSTMETAGFHGMEIKTMGSDREVILRTPLQEEGQIIADRIQEGITQGFPDNNFEVLRIDKVGPKIGEELRRNAIYAIVFALIGILIYLAFRFQMVYAIGAVIALFHDVLITIALIAIFNAVFPDLRLEFNQSMLAAFLTLVGFSTNDTVVIFDRIRENIRLFKNEPILEIMNKSINATLSRTIITSGTVFITVLVLFLFGGEVNRSFSFTFAVGIIAGTYSTIYIASSAVVEWKLRAAKTIKSIKAKGKPKPRTLGTAKS